MWMDVKDSCYRTKTPFLALLACVLACRRSPRHRFRAQSSGNNRKHGGIDCGNGGVCVAWCAIKRDIKSPIADPSRWLIVELIFPLLLLLQDGRSDTGFEAGRRSWRLQLGYVFFFSYYLPGTLWIDWEKKNENENERKDTVWSIRVFVSQVWRIRNSDDVLLIWIWFPSIYWYVVPL